MQSPAHLRRLARIWESAPVYFVTTCVANRRPLLADVRVHNILLGEWQGMRSHYGWYVGRYVIMPDHVHFFVCPGGGITKSLSAVIGKWKEWASKQICAALQVPAPLWQPEFFDHLLRSAESRSEKWAYVRNNPVRAGLVDVPEDWPFAGSIDFE